MTKQEYDEKCELLWDLNSKHNQCISTGAEDKQASDLSRELSNIDPDRLDGLYKSKYIVSGSGSCAVLHIQECATLKEAKDLIDSKILHLAVDCQCLKAEVGVYLSSTYELVYGKEWESDVNYSNLPKQFPYGIGGRYGLMMTDAKKQKRRGL